MATEKPAKTTKIVVKVTIEITREQIVALATEYGLGDGECVASAELREWVKGYIRGAAQGAAAAEFWTATAS